MTYITETLEKIGIKDFLSDKNYYESKRLNGLLDEDIDLLNPNKIDLQEFWRIAPEMCDAAITAGNIVKTNDDVERINVQNSMLAADFGLGDRLHLRPPQYLADIGAGFGMLQKFIPKTSKYSAYDVVARIDGVEEFDGKTLPEEILNCDTVVIFNVAQHLTKEIIFSWLKQLSKGSWQKIYLSDMIIESLWPKPEWRPKHKNTGIYHMYTCGQFTPEKSIQDYFQIFYDCGMSLYANTSRSDGMILFELVRPMDVRKPHNG